MATDTLPEMGFFDKHSDKIEYGAPSGCWLWAAGTSSKGYGSVRARGKTRSAHREAYEDVHGPIPYGNGYHGTCVRHRCDTPACVNPAHLEIGTVADNNRDTSERGRQAVGSAHSRAKLTEVDVVAIRAEYVHGCRDHGQGAMARSYGVSQQLVSRIVRREIWAHVQPPLPRLAGGITDADFEDAHRRMGERIEALAAKKETKQ